MTTENARKVRQRRILNWAQNSRCAGCGRAVGYANRGPRSRATYPTFDHVIPKSRGGHRVLINGLLKHRVCNEGRADTPPTGCDRVWQALVLARLSSPEAKTLWGLEFSPATIRLPPALTHN